MSSHMTRPVEPHDSSRRACRLRPALPRMTRDEWIAAQLAAAPPLTQAQQAELRRLVAPTPVRRSA